MKNRFFRMLALVLTLSILLPALLACSGSPATTPGDTTATTDTPGATPEPPETYGDPVQNPEPGPAFTLGEPLTEEELALLDRVGTAIQRLGETIVEETSPVLSFLGDVLTKGSAVSMIHLDTVIPEEYGEWVKGSRLVLQYAVSELGLPVFGGELIFADMTSAVLNAYLTKRGIVLQSPDLLGRNAYEFPYDAWLAVQDRTIQEEAMLAWYAENEETITALLETISADLSKLFQGGLEVTASEDSFKKVFGDDSAEVTSVTVSLTTDAMVALLESLRTNVAQSREIKLLLMSLLTKEDLFPTELDEEFNWEEEVDGFMTELDTALLNAAMEIHLRNVPFDIVFYLDAATDRLLSLEIGEWSLTLLDRGNKGTLCIFENAANRVDLRVNKNRDIFSLYFYDMSDEMIMMGALTLQVTEKYRTWVLSYLDNQTSKMLFSLSGSYGVWEDSLVIMIQSLELDGTDTPLQLNWQITLDREASPVEMPSYKDISEITAEELERVQNVILTIIGLFIGMEE